MLFNSIQFVCFFFPAVTLAYFLVPQSFRRFLLLGASAYFYMAFVPKYLLILIFLIVIDFSAGLLIERTSTASRRKALLIASLAANLGLLGFFKYFNFFNANLGALAGVLGWNYSIESLEIILPIGLSFHTFQSMAYVIDVFRRRQRAERDFWRYSLYVLYFPQMVAGPIERASRLLPQLSCDAKFDIDRFSSGMKLVILGFFKKVVIADRLAVFVDNVYGAPTEATGLSLLLATYFFALQIYCDFSGYTDIARGVSRILGIELVTNFDHPYQSRSVAEFWTRWHMSLSLWFRDYVYIPLGGNRVGAGQWARNIIVVFLLSGLWHGANWTFIIWGLLHGMYIVMGRMFDPLRSAFARASGLARWPTARALLQIAITFHLVTFAWIFFRANDLGDAYYVITNMFRGWELSTTYFGVSLFPFQQDITALALLLVAMALIATLLIVETVARRRGGIEQIGGLAVWSGALAVILLFGTYGAKSFIYFQF
jgi:alginate O-acetyltransferase complex protein AlgI